jgi:hypothetical protein
MPIEENLSPQLPSLTYKMNQTLNCLLSTTGLISQINQSNAKRIQGILSGQVGIEENTIMQDSAADGNQEQQPSL